MGIKGNMLLEGQLSHYTVMLIGGQEIEVGNYRRLDYCCTVRRNIGTEDYSCTVGSNSWIVDYCRVDTLEE